MTADALPCRHTPDWWYAHHISTSISPYRRVLQQETRGVRCAVCTEVASAREEEREAADPLIDEANNVLLILRAMMPYSGCGSCCLGPAATRLEAAIAAAIRSHR